jgi:HipA-like protein
VTGQIVTGDKLDIRFEEQLVGQLERKSENLLEISFRYAQSWLEGANNFPISLSMPLGREEFPPDLTYAWFMNLLGIDRMRRRNRNGGFRGPARRQAWAWTALAALVLNLLWPTTLVVASAADPVIAISLAPICDSADIASSDQGPVKAPGKAIHCPLCVVAGSQLVGPVSPILTLAAPSETGSVQLSFEPRAVAASILVRPQQARAPPLLA